MVLGIYLTVHAEVRALMDADARTPRNRQMMGKLLVIAVGMLGFGFAMVPMYRQICEAIGITQTRVVAPANTQVDASRAVTVELLASSAGLPWRFEALDREVKLHPGELVDGALPRGEHARAPGDGARGDEHRARERRRSTSRSRRASASPTRRSPRARRARCRWCSA